MATTKAQCPVCGSRLHNRKTVWLAPTYARQYFTCCNVECSETSVYGFERLHVVSPSGLGEGALVRALIERLRPDERQLALELLQNPAP